MINLIIFIISTIGLTNIVVHGKILDNIGLRPFLKKRLPSSVFELFECYECTGFWCGMIMGACIISPWMFLACGFAGCVISQFYSEIIYLIRSKTEYVIDDNKEE